MKDNPENPGFFFNLNEAASVARCSPRTIRRALEDGQIRAKKVRGRYLFSRKAVMAYGLGFGPRLSAVEKNELKGHTG